MNVGILTVMGVGLLVGFRHAFEPDHLAAVTTLATSQRRLGRAVWLGLAWGVGHTSSVAGVAVLLILLGVRVPESFFAGAELCVALLLVLLGCSTILAESRRHRISLGAAHSDAHASGTPHSHASDGRSVRRSLGFGLAHGMAGSGAVVALLAAAASTVATQFGYLAAFGVGTALGMSLVSLLTGALTGFAAGRSLRVLQQVRVGAALASALVGIVLGWRVVTGT